MDFIGGRIFASNQFSKIPSYKPLIVIDFEKTGKKTSDLIAGQRWLIFMLITTAFLKYQRNEVKSTDITVQVDEIPAKRSQIDGYNSASRCKIINPFYINSFSALTIAIASRTKGTLLYALKHYLRHREYIN